MVKKYSPDRACSLSYVDPFSLRGLCGPEFCATCSFFLLSPHYLGLRGRNLWPFFLFCAILFTAPIFPTSLFSPRPRKVKLVTGLSLVLAHAKNTGYARTLPCRPLLFGRFSTNRATPITTFYSGVTPLFSPIAEYILILQTLNSGSIPI